MRDDGADEWDVVLDEAFIRGGRSEASAQERVERAQRIAQGHAAAAPWRAAGAPPNRRPAEGGRWLRTLIVLLVLALVGWTWHVSRPGEPLGRPAAGPAGEGGYRFLEVLPDGSGRPVTFDPCRPIHYTVRPEGQPPSGPSMLAAALSEVSTATGLVFVGDGETRDGPSEDYGTSAWSSAAPAPVLIAWSTEAESPILAGDVAGYAGPVQVAPTGPASARYVSGQVVLDAEDLAHAPGDLAGAAAVRTVLLHELGHLVGLGHVDDPEQLMQGEGVAPATRGAYVAGRGFGPGDLRGLHELGQGRCF